MTHEEKINYLNIAAGICGFRFLHKDLDLLVSLYELVKEKKGETNVDQVVNIQSRVKDRDDAKSRSELLDKVSEKVK